MIPPVNIGPLAWDYRGKQPFDHCVIDNFWPEALVRELAEEFPQFDRQGSGWHCYDNPLEAKLTCNDWNRFGSATYRAFTFLNSAHFVELLRLTIGADYPLYADHGLHGGGLHAHGVSGKLKVHLDYELHPKTGLQRKLNLLVYLNPEWQDEWGGYLGL
jgi:Rps23 Pro-64 3,4-dihydroxylase Tpa1-like proline 4-hydroxylase